MLDRYGRRIHYLRVSVTDRCNLRCVYCMPQQGVEWVAHSAVLSYEQLLRLVGLLARLGVDKVRLTGGEPLVRRDLAQLVRGIRSVEGIQSVSLTTNGVLLKQQLPGLMEAGLSGVNLSLTPWTGRSTPPLPDGTRWTTPCRGWKPPWPRRDSPSSSTACPWGRTTLSWSL